MEIEYDASKFDAIVAKSPENAVETYQKRVRDEGYPFTGIVVTDKYDADGIGSSDVYLVKAIRSDSLHD